MKVHEGNLLQQWLTGEGMSPEDLAKRLGVKKQTVYYHIGRSIVGDSFKKKLQQLKSNPFDGNGKGTIPDATVHFELLEALKELNHVRKQLDECRNEIIYLKDKR